MQSLFSPYYFLSCYHLSRALIYANTTLNRRWLRHISWGVDHLSFTASQRFYLKTKVLSHAFFIILFDALSLLSCSSLSVCTVSIIMSLLETSWLTTYHWWNLYCFSSMNLSRSVLPRSDRLLLSKILCHNRLLRIILLTFLEVLCFELI